jgi:Mn-dependent DtxR family transcriptional regulator
MTDTSSPENMGPKELEKQKADEEACVIEQTLSRTDRARLLKHGGIPQKGSQSKREIMEELSRARFPWEE